MRNSKKYVQRLQLQFVLVVLGKPGREARTRSAQWHSNFVSNQKMQNIDVRTYKKGFSQSIQELYHVFIILFLLF